MGQGGSVGGRMQRPLCTVLVSFVLVTNLLEAQESKSPSSETEAHSTVGGRCPGHESLTAES